MTAGLFPRVPVVLEWVSPALPAKSRVPPSARALLNGLRLGGACEPVRGREEA